jgi:transposase
MEPHRAPQLPTVLNEEVLTKIGELLCAGNYLSPSCRAAGITYQIFCHWRKRWLEGDPAAARHHHFFEAIELASSVAETAAIGKLKKGDPGWQAQAWFLERRFPQRWGKQERTPLPPKRSKPLDQMTEDELARYNEEVAAARARP